MGAENAQQLVQSGKHNGVALGVVKGHSFNFDVGWGTVSAEGVVGPSARGINSKDLRGTLTFLVGPPVAPGTKGTLEVKVLKMDGTTVVTYSHDNMKAGSYSYAINDKQIAEFTQEFLCEDDMTTNPQHQT